MSTKGRGLEGQSEAERASAMRGDQEITEFHEQVKSTRAKELACAALISGALALAQFGPEDSIDFEDDPPPISVGHAGKVLRE